MHLNRKVCGEIKGGSTTVDIGQSNGLAVDLKDADDGAAQLVVHEEEDDNARRLEGVLVALGHAIHQCTQVDLLTGCAVARAAGG